MQNDGKTLGIIAVVASVAGAVLLALVLANLWRFSAAGGALLASGVLGLIGAMAGWAARGSAAAGLGQFGLRLGLATVLAVALLVGFLTPASDPVVIRQA